MGEALLRHHAEQMGVDLEVDSAGTGAWHVGEPAHRNTVALLRERSITFDRHQARVVETEWLDERDLVVAMDSNNYAALMRLANDEQRQRIRMFRSFDPELASEHDLEILAVPDPYYGTMDDYRAVMAMLDRASVGLLKSLS